MKVHIDTRSSWATNTVDVWFYMQMRDGMLYVQPSEGGWTNVEVPNGTMAPETPTLSLPREWFEELIKAGAKLPLAEDATVAHLADAKAVRDRLLRMVEHKMGVSS